jgi:hypothetical protein
MELVILILSIARQYIKYKKENKMYSDNFDSSKGRCEYPLSPWECVWDGDAEAEPCEICPYFKKKGE